MTTKDHPLKLKAFDMFSGCGGLTEGLKIANFAVLGAVELEPTAAETYRLNHSEVHLWEKDVRKLATSDVMKTLSLKKGELDLLAGCPPCQGFSTLRTKNGAISGRDKRNTLLQEFLRFAEDLLPKAIMLENVPGLEDYRLFEPFRKRLSQLGYRGQHRILDASEYSVPQRRKRLIYLAGMNVAIPFASPHEHKVTVRNAISHLQRPGKSGDAVHDLPERRSTQVQDLIKKIPKDGGSRSHLPKTQQLKCHQKCDGFKDVYGRMAWDRVAPTITSGCFNPSKGRFLHPDQNRAITIREAAILQGFKQNYKFNEKRGKVALALMVGNALPPPLIAANAANVHVVLTGLATQG